MHRLKLAIPNLIGPEQNGFLSRHSTFDNIISAQEITHSIDIERNLPPRMITKIDIEKAFDIVDWKAIIAILQRMEFPKAWISWVKSCLSSASFSFLINGSPSP